MRGRLLLALTLTGAAVAAGYAVREELPAMKRELKIMRM